MESFRTSALRTLDRLEQPLHVEDRLNSVLVSVDDLFLTRFITRNTRFPNFGALLRASGFRPATFSSIGEWPCAHWDDFIRQTSCFADWNAMLRDARESGSCGGWASSLTRDCSPLMHIDVSPRTGVTMAITIHTARITGPVAYLSANGRTVNIPLGPCVVERMGGPFTDIVWGSHGQSCVALPSEAVQAAQDEGHLVLLE